MALIFHDGFETGGFECWSSSGGVVGVDASYAHMGNYGARVGGSGVISKYGMGPVYRFSCYIYIDHAGSNNINFIGSSYTLGTLETHLSLDTTAHVDLYDDNVLVAEGTTALDEDTWYRISASIDASYNINVWIDGVLEHENIEGTSDSNFGGADSSHMFRLGTFQASSNIIYFDDCVTDGAYSPYDLGDMRVLAARPVAEGTDDDNYTTNEDGWADSSEAADAVYTEIDSDPPATASYNISYGNSSDTFRYSVHLDNCGTGNLADLGLLCKVKAINFVWYYKTDGGGADDYGIRIWDGISTWTDDNIDDPKVATWLEKYCVEDPCQIETPWTTALLNDTEMGMATVSSGGKELWWYEAYAMVAYQHHMDPDGFIKIKITDDGDQLIDQAYYMPFFSLS